MGVDLPAPAYAPPEQRVDFFRRLDDRLASLSGVHASLASAIPMGGAIEGRVLFVGQPDLPREQRPVVSYVTVGPRYFETVGAVLLRGREFDRDDGRPGQEAVIVNERFVQMHFSNRDPLGQSIRLRADQPWMTVVGVTRNVRQRTTESGAFDPVLYLPVAANPPVRINVLARSDAALAAVASSVREQVSALDADLPLYDLRTVEEQLALTRWPLRVFGTMFAIFAGIALVLAGVGLYAITAYSVAHRTQEIGVRMAFGADARQVRWLVTRGASRQLALGVLVGAVGAAALSRVLPAILAGSGGADPVTLIGVSALLLAVGVAAALIPARRAVGLDPMVALRTE
jgi:predicted permease